MAWVDLMLEASQGSLPCASSHELFGVLSALSTACYQPCQEWTDDMLQGIGEQLREGAYSARVRPGCFIFLI